MKSIMFYVVLFIKAFIIFGSPLRAEDGFSQPLSLVNNSLTISVFIGDARINDTLTIKVWERFVSNKKKNETPLKEIKAVQGLNGYFTFNFDTFLQPAYFSLSKKNDNAENSLFSDELDLLSLFLLEPGDDVIISFERLEFPYKNPRNILKINDSNYNYLYNFGEYHVTFRGKGWEKYQLKYDIDWINSTIFSHERLIDYTGSLQRNNIHDLRLELGLNLLSTTKYYLSKEIYDIMEADIIGKHQLDKLIEFSFSINFLKKQLNFNSDEIKKILLCDKFFPSDDKYQISASVAATSRFFPDYILKRHSLLSEVINPSRKMDLILGNINGYSEKLRERLLTQYLFDNYERISNMDTIIETALTTLNDPFYLELLDDFYKVKVKGAIAYNFSLEDINGNLVKLEDFTGKLVFVHFWFTGCVGCLSFYSNKLAPLEEHFQDDPNIVFIAISIDKNKETWIDAVNSHKYTSADYAVNLYTGGAGSSHPAIGHYYITGYPHVILINQKGEVERSDLFNRTYEEITEIISQSLK